MIDRLNWQLAFLQQARADKIEDDQSPAQSPL